jgi:hypothetical protein
LVKEYFHIVKQSHEGFSAIETHPSWLLLFTRTPRPLRGRGLSQTGEKNM